MICNSLLNYLVLDVFRSKGGSQGSQAWKKLFDTVVSVISEEQKRLTNLKKQGSMQSHAGADTVDRGRGRVQRRRNPRRCSVTKNDTIELQRYAANAATHQKSKSQK